MYISRYRVYSSSYTAAMPPFCDQAKRAHMGSGSPVNSMNHACHNAKHPCPESGAWRQR